MITHDPGEDVVEGEPAPQPLPYIMLSAIGGHRAETGSGLLERSPLAGCGRGLHRHREPTALGVPTMPGCELDLTNRVPRRLSDDDGLPTGQRLVGHHRDEVGGKTRRIETLHQGHDAQGVHAIVHERLIGIDLPDLVDGRIQQLCDESVQLCDLTGTVHRLALLFCAQRTSLNRATMFLGYPYLL